FLGYNPMATLVPANVLQALPAARRAALLGHSFFPNLISPPFQVGLHSVFYLSTAMCLVAALASLLRGKQRAPHQTEVGHGSEQTQLGHTVWIQSAWYQLRYREALNFLPAAARPGRCSRTDGLNRRTGSEPVLIGKYRSITLSRPTLPGQPVGFQPFPFKTAP